jgi:hypothetical protein
MGFHTTAATFGVMLKDHQVWSIQISCLNDETEFRHAVDLVRKAIRPCRTDADANARWLAEYVDDALEEHGADYSWFFVFCMSESKDDLSQWRAYGGGENGVSIGFSTELMLINKPHPSALLFPVSYVEEQQLDLAGDIAKWTIEFFQQGLVRRLGAFRQKWANSYLDRWRSKIIYFAPMLKAKAFQAEKEWRWIISLSREDLSRIEIRQRHSLISRHLPVSFGHKLPISEVVVGPSRHKDVSRSSVGTYLQAKGYAEVTVNSSTVPFQTT